MPSDSPTSTVGFDMRGGGYCDLSWRYFPVGSLLSDMKMKLLFILVVAICLAASATAQMRYVFPVCVRVFSVADRTVRIAVIRVNGNL